MPDASASSSATASGSDDNEHHFVNHAVTVSAFTMVSRITGLLRDAALAALLGLGAVADAFFLGFLIPNLFRRLFGEGALTASFLPVYTELTQHDPEKARRLAGACLGLLGLLLAAITVAIEVVLLAMLAWGEWSPETGLALRLIMLMLPYMPLICAVALLGAILQVHGRFGPPAAAPVLLNLLMLAGIGAAGWWLTQSPDTTESQVVFIVAGSVLLAGLAQLLWQVLAARDLGVFGLLTALRPREAKLSEPIRAIALAMGPMVIGAGVFQFNALLDALIAFCFSPKTGGPDRIAWLNAEHPIQVGAVAALQWAQRLYQFPLGVFGIAIATAIFPALAAAAIRKTDSPLEDATASTAPASDPDEPAAPNADPSGVPGPAINDAFFDVLRRGLRLTFYIGLPATVGLILTATPLTRLIYQYGQFNAADTARVATILTGYASAVWAYSVTHVLTRAFYALRDPVTPLRVTLVMVVANLALNLTLIWPLGAAGLAWSTAITAIGQALVLLALLRRRGQRAIGRSVWSSWVNTVTWSIAMGGAVWLIGAITQINSQSRAASAAILAAMVAAGAITFALGTWLIGMQEPRWLLRRKLPATTE